MGSNYMGANASLLLAGDTAARSSPCSLAVGGCQGRSSAALPKTPSHLRRCPARSSGFRLRLLPPPSLLAQATVVPPSPSSTALF